MFLCISFASITTVTTVHILRNRVYEWILCYLGVIFEIGVLLGFCRILVNISDNLAIIDFNEDV